ncbi:cytochrome-c oxidase, cbb3-type subunit III [Oceanicoccus sagamiensis]|uniref:Cbb3-type cytochrome c oxidase subunit n=1 Tax=Oceanicoccus sagamiensis TaxID=716816 RepID=A0A1X9NAV1_9GAMM|nr:cytochrome-c oxidase, cbb3-type subunit III [Oceanicoccus sagamiensis]ARN74746.1 cytochrome-c oxidase, cbb3-type subunit III [Oceanicoccus sagamiensis]
MSSFWSLWIIVLTTIMLIGTVWILFANRKTKNTGPDATTGHVYDGIEEYDNPLPAWWFYLFVITIVYSIGYLIAYPGMGSFKGVLGWTQINQYEKQVAKAEQKYGAIFAQYRDMPVEQVIQDGKALKMGQRMFANNCAQCHGSDARGSYGFPNLTDGDWLYGGSPEQIKTTLIQGRSGVMPAWAGPLGEEGIVNVSNYVLSLNGRAVDADSAAAGQEKFAMFCTSCHGADGTGNIALGAPNLTNNIWLYGGSPGLVQRTLRNGRNGQMPSHEKILSEDKIHLLTAYVYSLSQTPAEQE